MRRIFPRIALVLASSAFASSCAFAGFGVIAYNPTTGASSESHGWFTYEQAANTALWYCGLDCQVINWEANSCIALATGFGHWGEGHGFITSADAATEAVIQCGADCTVKEWACN